MIVQCKWKCDQADQPLLELETDKATMEVPSPVAGVITILVQADQVVQVGQKIADIDPAGKAVAAPAPASPQPAPKPTAEVRASPAAAAAIRDKDLDPS